jgi:membrane associated rhomboid family serine protease
MVLLIVALGTTLVISGLASRNGWTNARAIYDLGGIYGPLGNDWWRLLTAPFLFDNAGYEFITLLAVGIFGTALERRFGWYAPVFVFLLAGAAGSGLAVVAKTYPAFGANGAALGLLAAWFVEYRLTRSEYGDADMLGAGVFAAVLFLLSAAWEPASIAAAVGGAAAGSLCGFMLAQRAR